MYALIDGNNFYVSCQRAFDPRLQDRAVVVLSSNDGCVIARSDEAKRLGIRMGQPYFEMRALEQSQELVALSANFELYGDMSNRMMRIAASLGPDQEIYSIDESFIGGLDGMGDLTPRARSIREKIFRNIGIPCCVGLAPTKTLAKLCNHVAKDSERKPGSYPKEFAQICNWQDMTDVQRQEILKRTAAGDVWGIGRRIAQQLAQEGCNTAWDVSRLPSAYVRKRWGVVLERTLMELNCVSCIALELAPPPKKQIACTRSFGHPISEIGPLIEAVSEFATRAAEKARKAQLVGSQLYVFAHTSPFRSEAQWSANATIPLARPTADTGLLVQAATTAIARIYQPGHKLSKAGVMLLDLCNTHAQQQIELLPEQEPLRDRHRLMQALDAVNDRFGKGALKIASCGFESQDEAGWRMKQEKRSPRYTTRIEDVPVVLA